MITKLRLGHCGGRGGGQIEDPLDDENRYQQVLHDVKNNELRREVRALRRCVARLETLKNGDSHFVDHDDAEIDNPFARAGGERRFPRRGAELLRSFGARLKIPEFNGKASPDVFLNWLTTIERIFNLRNFSDKSIVQLVASKLINYASNWWFRVQLQRFRAGKSSVRSWATMRNLLLRKFYFKNFRGEADESRCTRQPIRCFKCHGFGHIQAECPNLQFITVVEVECLPDYTEYLEYNLKSVVVDDNQMDDIVRASSLDEILVADITRNATMDHHNEEANKSAIELDSPPVYDIYPDESMESDNKNELVLTYQSVLRTFDVTRLESKIEYTSLMPINKCGFYTAHKFENKVENQTTCADVIYSGLNFGKELKHVSANALILSVIAGMTVGTEHCDVLSEKLLDITQGNKFEMVSNLHFNSQVTLDRGGNFMKMNPTCSINLMKVDRLLVEIFGSSIKSGVPGMVNTFVEAKFVFLAINRRVFKHRKKQLFNGHIYFSSYFSKDTIDEDSWSSLLQQGEYDVGENGTLSKTSFRSNFHK
ncbi:hypothetical protein CASFOL_024719 [Castilleja foliolosa]|uniref:CCHC-type domain-containing protein n=1 Tax=Castilleja foliolosa TaxID=1961234 RepID=A0ABD3CSS2_9LAMI